MNRKLKFALLTLLGFAPACSTVKTPRSTSVQLPADSVVVPGDTLRQMIRVMYGVRPPLGPQEEQPRPDSAVVVRGYGQAPRRVVTAYGVPSPKDSVAAQPNQDTTGGFKCVMPPPPKDYLK